MSPVIEFAVEILKSRFGGIKVEILGEVYKNGSKLGVDLRVEGIKVFLEYQLAEDISSWGPHIADEFIMPILKEKYKYVIRDIKIDDILKNKS